MTDSPANSAHVHDPSQPPANSSKYYAVLNVTESDLEDDEGPYGSDDTDNLPWIAWFCSLRGHEFFCEVEDEFIEDEFNLTGLNQDVSYYNEALETILDGEEDSEDPLDADEIEEINAASEVLYGLIHARFILTRNGLRLMAEKYKNGDFGVCPRYACNGVGVVPCGTSDTADVDTVKLFCPSCLDIYTPSSSRYQNVDGACFGTTFPNLFFQAFPQLIPESHAPIYTPTIYGFAINERSPTGPRMQWLRMRPEYEPSDTTDSEIYDDAPDAGELPAPHDAGHPRQDDNANNSANNNNTTPNAAAQATGLGAAPDYSAAGPADAMDTGTDRPATSCVLAAHVPALLAALPSVALAAAAVYIVYCVVGILAPPGRDDGGVPCIPVTKTLRWMTKGAVGRYEVSQKLDGPYMREAGIVKAWMFGGWAYKVGKAEYARRLFMQTDVFQKVNIRKLMPHNLGPRVTGISLSFENGDAYRGHRAVVSPAFRRSWPTLLFRKPLLELMDVMERESARPLDVLLWFRRGTLDVLGHIVMSYDFRALSDPDNKQRAMYDSLLEAMLHPLYNMFPWLDLFATGQRARQWEYLGHFNAFIDSIIDDKLAEMESRPPLTEDERNHADLLTLLLEAYLLSKSGKVLDDRGKPVAPLTHEQLRNNIALFYVAGYDTTANSLSYVMMELARFPDVQQKARAIVIGVLGDRKDAYPTDDQIKELGYMDLIVKETLRRNSILAEIRRRLAAPVQLGPYTLPKGAVVSVDTWAMHYNPDYFPDPDRFVPERFADDKTAELKPSTPLVFAPFSNGSRQCIGMRFSLVEQRVAIALLLLRFEWTLPKDSPFWHSTPAAPAGLISPVGLMVDIKPRF
ncbi:casein kinase 2 regulatory subunit [Coemansia javaensis]|uniref:Casein kinase II subunit beta n=1 Tax=Coemansia javaensis TaxID=2761396 RepID=A0A9W8LHB2_9FUNG|nr:casein kinase 2 regulatory subunit [Coemansia javaensis]